MRTAERGYQLIELLIAMAISSLVLTLGIPPLLQLAAGLRVELAAAEVASAFHVARAYAIRHDANVGLKFRVDADGTVTWGLYRDGDGDGVLSADILSGDDPPVMPRVRLAHLGRQIHFGFPPGRAPRDPGDPRRRLDRLDDPVRFNRSDIASFSPIGTATPGTVYVTDGRRHLSAARVFGRTGKIGCLAYDLESERWR
ncbi:MAG: prepilin-type N-terminal cleavage/methylation domain-containing protein [Thermoanaerobaculia bacterium]|jgi:prepilin-type N-terminal cleavage/methylation domain-containing protein|nr:prepilin-type N-terminal cleavage/methylation domain-containing protein [Thermoanaerobaculia bacterium]MBP9825392.1 prepilin-type N-terminal cleavage/methylation domain-containing protein [Thermoanaerobaculia bacterium]